MNRRQPMLERRLNKTFDEAIKTAFELETLVASLGFFISGTPSEIGDILLKAKENLNATKDNS